MKSESKEIHREFDCMIDTPFLCISDSFSRCSLGIFVILLSAWFLILLFIKRNFFFHWPCYSRGDVNPVMDSRIKRKSPMIDPRFREDDKK